MPMGNIDARFTSLLVFYFLYRFVDVGFRSIIVYYAYAAMHSVYGSALAVAMATLGSGVGLLIVGLYALYVIRPQVLMLMFMAFRGVLILTLMFFGSTADHLTVLLAMLLTYSVALWIERSILGGIAVENVPSIARGLNALNLAFQLGGLAMTALLVVFLRIGATAFGILALLQFALMTILGSLLLSRRVGLKVTIPRRAASRTAFSGDAVTLYAMTFIHNISISILLSIAPSFGALLYAIFYVVSEVSSIAGRVIFMVIGDRVVLSGRLFLYGTLLGLALTLIAYIYREPLAMIIGITSLNALSAAGTVFTGNALRYVLADAIYNVRTLSTASSLFGALYGSLILLTPTPGAVLITTFLAIASTFPALHRKVVRIGMEIMRRKESQS